MAACGCDSGCSTTTVSPRFRKALWIALVINTAMFGVELGGGLHSGSVSLLADAIDFAGDAANYGISLAVLSMGLMWRSRAALVKGFTMAGYGVLIIGKTIFSLVSGAIPEPFTMGAIAVLALIANGGVAVMLYAHREGDANMRSVWLCSRNDAIGNVAVMLAAIGVSSIGSNWPDLAVAAIMGCLALSGGISVIRQASAELRASTSSATPVKIQMTKTSE
ncbi:MAG TPA: cation diffusion facilitator family transporter [Rhodocyclaceae bacterium]|nr:cation diffusion facilitator family transporter [Rhodocyclaceae bacterium]